ncbi:MAG: type I methionyl aminopeptidase [Candidatus Levybacteria bacterium]|nr:type I methionyl aminopeptidase [Candidatus Levybacteria bacterium]
MVDIKTKKDLEIMSKGGAILTAVLHEVLEHVKPGVSELELDRLAEKLILQKGGEPGFKKIPGYKHTICISTNDVVVHGIPTNYKLREGDIVGIDCGVFYNGFHTDMAETVQIQNDNEKIKKFLDTGKHALEEAIKQARIGNRIGHISKTIQEIVERDGYSAVRSLIGHGVGRELHEEPEVPGFLNRKIEKTPLLTEGMTIAIEVIYNMGKHDVVYSNQDGWTIKTADGSISGLFERTIAIIKNGARILT